MKYSIVFLTVLLNMHATWCFHLKDKIGTENLFALYWEQEMLRVVIFLNASGISHCGLHQALGMPHVLRW